ncbi:hypothetical protein HanIR_Chr01g0014381 [Helianthus annuus]|nr:hypothetical protein HanIR_Chr01g0014381 [Helianthus annuus]
MTPVKRERREESNQLFDLNRETAEVWSTSSATDVCRCATFPRFSAEGAVDDGQESKFDLNAGRYLTPCKLREGVIKPSWLMWILGGADVS